MMETIASEDVKLDRPTVKPVLDVLKKRSAAELKIGDRTLRRYLTGDLPEQWEILFENPDLALAVLRVALRLDAGKSGDPFEP